MLGKMLTEKDFEELQNMKSVAEIGVYLRKDTYYGGCFDLVSSENIHRGQLEIILHNGLMKDALRISKYLRGHEKMIYRYIYRKQEIEDLKKMLRVLQTQSSLKKMDRHTLFVDHHSKINFDQAFETTSAKELVETLKGTKFYPILTPLLYGIGKIDLFAAEMALDVYYHQRLVQAVKKGTSGENRKVLKESFGLETDFRNIMWIYRGKHYYHLKKEILYRYMLPGGEKLKKNKLIELVEAASIEDLLTKLERGPYGAVIDFESSHWENSFYQYYRHKQKVNIRLLPGTIGPVIGYMSLKEIEIMNITTIIEGVRYQVTPEEINSHLVKQGKRKEG